MITLAIDFSSERRAVAVTDHAEREGTAWVDDRQTGALTLVQQALDAAGIDRGEVQLIAVGLGPGSYTGIRSAIALAQGWQLATGVRLAGVSSVEVLARSVVADGDFTICVDAQRGEFYRADYRRIGDAVAVTKPLVLVAAENLTAAGRVFSPDVTRLPDGSERLHPDPMVLARLAVSGPFAAAEELEPVYLREVEFKKAPPAREIR